jgi:hypothetical protein
MKKSTESARRLPQARDVVVEVCDVTPKLVAMRDVSLTIARALVKVLVFAFESIGHGEETPVLVVERMAH